MKTLHLGFNPVPGHIRFSLGNPYQKESQEAEEHVRLNPLTLPVIDGSQIQGRLQVPEGSFHFHQLFVTQDHILRSQGVVAGGNDVLPVKMGLLFNLALVLFTIMRLRDRVDVICDIQ
jgi:hypothetical protein